MEAPGSVAGRSPRLPIHWRATTLVGLLCVVVAASAVGRWVLLGPVRRLAEIPGPAMPTDVVSPLVALVLAVFGALVVIRGESRRYGWLLLAIAAATGIIGFAAEYSVYATLASTGSLPFRAVAGWVQDLWMVTSLLAFLLLPALFPDGTPASGRWGRWVKVVAAVWVALIVVFMVAERPLTGPFLELDASPANPTGVLSVPEMAINLTWVAVTLLSIVIGLGSLVTRWRGADTEPRQQLKWVLFAFGLLLAVAAADLANLVLLEGVGVDLGLQWALAALMAITMIGLAVALGFAVLKFRLYDVDLVINRTIVYAALTVIIVVTYVAVVVGIGALLPVEELILSLAVTGVVAVAFSPLRTWLQRWVNRVMFGQRDDPYVVLSELGRLVARSGAPDTTLQTLAETVATALKLPGAAVELEQDGAWQTRATFGQVPDPDAGGIAVPLHYQEELVGRLVVAPRSPRESLSEADRRLLEDIAHHAGALANAVRLTMALQTSREGLVLAREEERRRLRRDLHDGLGPSLASQTFRLDAVLERLHDDPDAAAELVAVLKRQNQDLVADIRRLVYELRPPALDQLGLAGALTAHAGQLDRNGTLSIEVETVPDPLPTLPAAVEVAAYRIAREAITNVVHHADASRCTVTLTATDAALSIEIRDDGVGLAPGIGPGVGLTSMRERAEELGGSFAVTASDPAGTRIRATLPIAASPNDPRNNGQRPAHQGTDPQGPAHHRSGAQHG